jgi:S-adenosylmethionine synthetase
VNAADAADGSSVYMTVTGTSAECGDDGEVGRGNRANGAIAPLRPASMEALAGKNPVTHVGKLYNVVAREIAADLVASISGVAYAECYLVSRIGAPIDARPR